MSFSAKKFEPIFTAIRVWYMDDFICIQMSDGREVKAPLEFYPTLKNASKEQRENFRLIGLGTGIHWPDLDEDLSIEGIVLGRPARL